MSPKKKPTPTKSAPKDDLIDALYESESVGSAALKNSQKSQTNTETLSRLSNFLRPSGRGNVRPAGQRPPPPPPPARDASDRIYNFDDPTASLPRASREAQGDEDVYDASKDNDQSARTLSIVRSGPKQISTNEGSIPTFDSPSARTLDLELEELKTVVHQVSPDDSGEGHSQTNSKHGISRLSQHAETKPEIEYGNVSRVVPEMAEEDLHDYSEREVSEAPAAEAPAVIVAAKPGDKLQKLEDVLRKLKPQFPGAKPDAKTKSPLYDSDTANAAMEAQKAASGKQLDSVQPPPVNPIGEVAKSLMPERAPTEPVRDASVSVARHISIDPNVDEKTVAAQATPAPAMKPEFGSDARPVWQDAKTEVLSRMTTSDNPDADPEAEQFMPTEIRANSPGARFREEARQAQPGAAIFSSAEAALRQSENLRVAQKRISDLENELERVRRENESLRSAGDTLRRRMDELQAHAENAELNTQEAKKIAEEERKVLKGQIQSRDREIAELKGRIDDAENRLESNFRKIRVRERDLEHRIEIIKAESQSIAASKDRMILELKRQIDQISSELNHSKAQLQETFGQFKEKQETARRAVRALRIALTVLEGEDDSGSRKAE